MVHDALRDRGDTRDDPFARLELLAKVPCRLEEVVRELVQCVIELLVCAIYLSASTFHKEYLHYTFGYVESCISHEVPYGCDEANNVTFGVLRIELCL